MRTSPRLLRELLQPLHALRIRWDIPVERPWKHLAAVLLAGYALRIALAVSSDHTWRIDEAIQYLEQAHRVVFGYGFVPWEVEVHARTWLIAVLPIAVLQACALLGLDHPDQYIPIMRAVNATASMAVPIGAYVLCRRMLSEAAGRAACVFACFWYELIVFAPHTLAELYSSYLLFGALALLQRRMGVPRSLAAGMLLSLAAALRVPHALAAGVFGLALLLLPLTPRSKLAGAAGAALGAFAWGLVDLMTTGSWFGSFVNYLEYAEAFVRGSYRRATLVSYGNLPLPSLGLALLATGWAVVRWRAIFPVSAAFLLLLAFFLAFPLARPYSSMALAIMLGGICAAALWAGSGRQLRAPKLSPARMLLAAAFAFVSIGSLLGLLPGHKFTEANRSQYFAGTNPEVWIYRTLSREPAGSVTAIWHEQHAYNMITHAAGYYHMHQDAVIYFPQRKWLAWLQADSALQKPPEHASHVITTNPHCYPNHQIVTNDGFMHLLRRIDLTAASARSEKAQAAPEGWLPPMRAVPEKWENVPPGCLQGLPREWHPPRLHGASADLDPSTLFLEGTGR